jgi:hypothetical protein
VGATLTLAVLSLCAGPVDSRTRICAALALLYPSNIHGESRSPAFFGLDAAPRRVENAYVTALLGVEFRSPRNAALLGVLMTRMMSSDPHPHCGVPAEAPKNRIRGAATRSCGCEWSMRWQPRRRWPTAESTQRSFGHCAAA